MIPADRVVDGLDPDLTDALVRHYNDELREEQRLAKQQQRRR